MSDFEECTVCSEYTGRAGEGEDSIYLWWPTPQGYKQYGPLCLDCHGGITALVKLLGYEGWE